MRYLITGAGTLGTALAKVLVEKKRRGDDHSIEAASIYIKVIDNSEDSLWRFEEALGSKAMEDVSIELRDIRDADTMRRLVPTFETVIHTAAYKHLGYAEKNAMEVVKTNVIGTMNIIESLAHDANFIFVSTDKACYPTNIYGESKRIGEEMTRYASKKLIGQIFSVRMGNFLGSRGSVIDKWKEQVKKGDIRLTDDNMNRFFIKPSEVADFILDLLKAGAGEGNVYIPRMKVVNMARMALAFSLLNQNCEIQTIGMGQREKMDEIVANAEETARIRQKGNYFVIKEDVQNELEGVELSTAILPLLSLKETTEYIKDVV